MPCPVPSGPRGNGGEMPAAFMHKPPLAGGSLEGRRIRFSRRPSALTFEIETDMAVPKRKVSPSRRNMRRAHDALGTNAYTEDKDTGELRRSHHIDLKTGTYRGRQVLTPKED